MANPTHERDETLLAARLRFYIDNAEQDVTQAANDGLALAGDCLAALTRESDLAQCYLAAGSTHGDQGATDEQIAGHAIDAVELQARRLTSAEQRAAQAEALLKSFMPTAAEIDAAITFTGPLP